MRKTNTEFRGFEAVGGVSAFIARTMQEDLTKGRFLVTQKRGILAYHAWPLIHLVHRREKVKHEDYVKENDISEEDILGGGCTRYRFNPDPKNETARLLLFGCSIYGPVKREIILPYRKEILRAHQIANPEIRRLYLYLNWRPITSSQTQNP